MVEVKDNGDVTLLTEGQQVLHREADQPIIILQCQPRLAVVAQAFKASSEAV